MILITDTKATQFYFQVHCSADFTWLKIAETAYIKNQVLYYNNYSHYCHIST